MIMGMHILIFTAKLDFNLRWNVVTLAEKFPNFQFTILLHAPRKQIGRLVLNQLGSLRRHGWRWIPHQSAEIVSLLRTKCFAPPSLQSPDRPGQMFTYEALELHPRIELRTVTSMDSAETQAYVKALAPDLGIALGAPILKEDLYSLPRLGTINVHKGRMPHYRGMTPALWELENGETSVGCTVHAIKAGLDTGDIILERSVPIDSFSTFAGMQAKLHRVGVEMICETVEQIASGTAVRKVQPAGGATNSPPRLAAVASLGKELSTKNPSHDGIVKLVLKPMLFIAYARGLMPMLNYWHGRTNRQRVIILLYHRISDQFRDNVTTGIDQFEQHMAYLATNFVTVSLKQIVEGNIPRNASKPIIAVSFDDGYLDNFENAAPVLLKHQVPCTFFVSTEKIRDNKPFDHDMRTLGFGLDNMSWNQVRQMRDWGLHFGSHTRTHVNLAEVSDEIALQELQGSLDDIRTELGQQQVFIAYPYGRKQHITAERIHMIAKLGYAACFSAYGGLNKPEFDMFNIQRIGVNWAFDLTALHARLRGWDKTQ